VNIVVLLKQVPDTESIIQLTDTGKSIDFEEVKWVINPYDEYSIEEALLIKERREDVTITVLTAGNKNADESIRTAYALGVDEGIRINITDLPQMGSWETAKVLTAALRLIPCDILFAGYRAVDDDNYQVPAAVAKMMERPYIAAVTRLEFKGPKINCDHLIEGGFATVESDIPAVLTTHKGLNEPRYPNMRAIMKARKRDVKILEIEEIGLTTGELGAENAKVKITNLFFPPQRKQGRIIEGATALAKAAALVKLLKEEADII
jgi:electron transfer flavoprotein beta subunit